MGGGFRGHPAGVFIMGGAGTGKSSVWKTVAIAFGLLGDRTLTEVINPAQGIKKKGRGSGKGFRSL